MNIYVGNISNNVSEENLKESFEEFGEVTSAKVINDNYTGNSKGFGFVEMPNKTEAQAAIDNLNGTELFGKKLVVNEARPKKKFDNRGGGGGDYPRRNFNSHSNYDRRDGGDRRGGGDDRRGGGDDRNDRRNRY